jgi:hypothetical protein
VRLPLPDRLLQGPRLGDPDEPPQGDRVTHAVEDSSGNAAASLAAYAARAGIVLTVFCPASASAGKLTQIRVYGAGLRLIEGPRQRTTDALLEHVAKSRRVLRVPPLAPVLPRGGQDAGVRDRRAGGLAGARRGHLPGRRRQHPAGALPGLRRAGRGQGHRADAAALRRAGGQREPGLPRIRGERRGRRAGLCAAADPRRGDRPAPPRPWGGRARGSALDRRRSGRRLRGGDPGGRARAGPRRVLRGADVGRRRAGPRAPGSGGPDRPRRARRPGALGIRAQDDRRHPGPARVPAAGRHSPDM